MKGIMTNIDKVIGENGAILSERQMLGRLPICRRTLANWRLSGKIPYIKMDKRVLFHWPSVEAALLRLQRGGVE